MKYVRFETPDTEVKYGVVDGEKIHVIKGSIFNSYEIGTESYFFDQVKLLAPVGPSKIIGFGLNYQDHAEEIGESLPKEPMFFLKPPNSIIGHYENIIYPKHTKNLHYEVELAIVIGKTAKNISYHEASNYILGYTIGNDLTARDLQEIDGQWGRAKGFDTFCPLGPWIETDVQDVNNLKIVLKVNDKVKQNSNTKNLSFNCYKLIEFVSQITTLFPGDVILTGTPGGAGPLQIGDKVEAYIENIGTLENTVTRCVDSEFGGIEKCGQLFKTVPL
ncbi:fumarylacetoacetate hydrolase family protein [Neobacillus sp. SAB-20_R2A]|uniref:fumarylacetoacetate hydrolase family protein n=1 Tax=Neobacillus sp. SAB-20_R2A TaxID=3120519 RepID=UPI003C6DC76B